MKKIILIFFITASLVLNALLGTTLAIIMYSNFRETNIPEYDLWLKIQTYKSATSNTYTQDPKLCELAGKRVEQMHVEFDHRLFEENSQAFLTEYGLQNIGENLLERPAPAIFTHLFGNYAPLNEWLKSPSHRKNLDDSRFTHSCVKCDTRYCVQMFGQY